MRGRSALGPISVLFVVVALWVGVAPTASAAPAQEPALTTTSGAFGTEPGTTPGETTADTEPAVTDTEPGATSGRSAEIDAENRRILLIIAGLLAVAVALSLLTVRYWKATKPVPLTDDADLLGAEADVLIETAAVARRGPRSRMSVAGADHVTSGDDWLPRGTGEHVRVERTTFGVRPSREQRAAALAAARRG